MYSKMSSKRIKSAIALILSVVMVFSGTMTMLAANTPSQHGEIEINNILGGDVIVSGTAYRSDLEVKVDFPGGVSQNTTVTGGNWLVSIPSGAMLHGGDTVTATLLEDTDPSYLLMDLNLENMTNPGSASVQPNDTLEYIISVSNSSPSLSTLIFTGGVVTIVVPDDLTFQGNTVKIDNVVSTLGTYVGQHIYDDSSKQLSVYIDSLAAGDAKEIVFLTEANSTIAAAELLVNTGFTSDIECTNYTATATVPGKITYNGNGAKSGTVPIDAGNYAENANVTVLGNTGNLTRSGYTFIGWNTAANGSQNSYNVGSKLIMPKSDIVLYAQWKGGGGDPTYPKPSPKPSPEPTPEPTNPKGSGRDSNNPYDTIVIIGDEMPPLGSLERDIHIKYITGYPDGSVQADGNITRAEAAAIFYRLLLDENKDDVVTSIFPDVLPGSWYSRAVNYLTSLGIIAGYTDGTFRPDQPITRAEFTTIVSKFDSLISTTGTAFIDVAEDHWAVPYINSSYIKTWIDGYEDYSFKPEQNIARAEVVKMVNTMLTRLPDNLHENVNPYNDITSAHWAYIHIIEASLEHEYTRNADGIEIWDTVE